MTCFTCERNLSAYIDDELTTEVRLDVDAHLETCERCQRDYEHHLAAWEAAGMLRTPALPDGLWEKIESGLRKQRPPTTPDDLAVIVRGMAREVREVRQALGELRQDLESARPVEERPGPRSGGVRLWNTAQLGIEKVGGEKVRRQGTSEE